MNEISSQFAAAHAGEPLPLEQALPIDTGLGALLMMAKLHGIAADEAQLQHAFGYTAFTSRTIVLASRQLGMTARIVRQPPERLGQVPLPAIAVDDAGEHFILARVDVADAAQSKVLLQYPGKPPEVLALTAFLSRWSGDVIFFTSKASYAGEMSKFDFTWFIPAIVKYRRLLGEILVISLVLQLIGLVTPMFFQVVMDKVLVNHAMKTLNVIAVGLVFAIVFEALLAGIRTYVFAQTSSKIDVELGARLFHHLLGLPIAYFQSRRVGDSVARMHELESIRSFLTGNAMTVVLDFLFSFVFLAVMAWYSVWLTLIVLASIPVYFALSMLLTPVLRARLNEKFNRGAENQSFLVETIGGVDTVKAMALEPRWQQKWEKQLAGYVAAGLATSNIALVASGCVNLVSKIVTALIMWFGARFVIDGDLSVGELVAFNMLSGQVATPILRIAQLWNDFQQVGISMSRLGDILNARTEVSGQKARLPRISGAITLERVSFRYRPDAAEVLRDVSIEIAPGEVIGIVGRSGSGKSTLTRLVQRLYVPERGRVLIDAQDMSVIDTTSLRRQIGVVLQENVLFSRSVRENIAVSDPAMSLEQVIAAAKLAGAHDFICELPEGYETVVGEHGTGLSGGQRQRIAIARALITNPRVLIFDEATSALDYESERIIQNNMRRICAGRTVLIIAHRLSAVREANRIVVMDRGQVAEIGSHEALLALPDGIYAYLHRLQRGEDPADGPVHSAQAEGAA